MSIKEKIRTIPDFPKKGIMFRDITTLLLDPEGFNETIDALYKEYSDKGVTIVAGIEARGFILAGALAYKLGLGFVPIRKKGKLPGKTVEHTYDLEYGTDTVEIHSDALQPGDKVLIIDDLLATGGTILAAAALVKKLHAEVDGIGCIVELPDIGGSARVRDAGYSFHALCSFEGE